jgi:hypothetical protein
MTDEFSLHRTTRRVENGYEIVTHTFPKDELYLLKIISSGEKDNYKKAVCEISGYPLEEWRRIKEITPIKLEDGGYRIEVWFRNPGKQFEKWLRESRDSLISIRQLESNGIGFDSVGQLSRMTDEMCADALSYLRE